jgi:hypothetical protein
MMRWDFKVMRLNAREKHKFSPISNWWLAEQQLMAQSYHLSQG